MLCLNNYPHNLTKYEINETSKIPISQFFNGLGKNLGGQPKAYIQKIHFPFFSWILKNWEVQLEVHSKIPKSLWELGKLGSKAQYQHSKNPNFESMDELGTYMS